MSLLRSKLSRTVFGELSKVSSIEYLSQKIYTKFFNFPKILQLLITDECNLDCIYCYVNRKNNTNISIEKCLDILDQAKRMKIKIVTFTGGEPFLHPRFREIMTRANNLGLDIEILTNGTIITDDWVKFLRNISKRVNLSLVFKFSYDKETYKLHTKADMFDTVVSNIKKCIDSGLSVFAFIVLTRYEHVYVDEILESSKKLGVWPIFQRYIPTKDQKTNTMLEISAKEYNQGLLKLRDFYQKNKKIYGDYYYLSAKLRGSICACYRDMVVISAKADILPCPAAPLELSIGNIKNISLEKAWKLYRKEKRKWLRMSSTCFECKLKGICGGGCISHKYLTSGKFDIDDPLCFQPNKIATVEGLSAPCRMHEN